MQDQLGKSGCLLDGECHDPGSRAMKQGYKNINNLFLSPHMSAAHPLPSLSSVLGSEFLLGLMVAEAGSECLVFPPLSPKC